MIQVRARATVKWLVAVAAVTLATLLGDPASAQGFDCEKASTRVERMICANPELSRLDGEMFDTFHKTMDVAADQNAVLRAQRLWLKQRDRCVDVACVTQSYRDRSEVLARAPRAGWKTYSDASLGVSFQYLANRMIKPCPQEWPIKPCVLMRGWWFGKRENFMSFHVVPGALEAVAREEAGFQPVQGRWMTTYGRGTPQVVERFNGPGWQGMRATIACGITDENGFHAVAGECLWAVVSDGSRSVVISTEGSAGLDADSQRSISSLKFLSR